MVLTFCAPAAPVTVTVYLPGVVPGVGGGGPPVPPPPQPVKLNRSMITKLPNTSDPVALFAGALRLDRTTNIAPIGRPNTNIISSLLLRLGVGEADVAVVLIAMVTLATAPPGVTEVGVKLQAVFAGSPEQLSAMAVLKSPPWGVIESMKPAVFPATTETSLGAAAAMANVLKPLPERAITMVCAVPELNFTIRLPVRLPKIEGVKVTFTVQVAALASDVPQLLLWV